MKVNYFETDSLDSLPSKSMQENMHLSYKHECVSQIKFLKSDGIFAGSDKSNNFVAYFDGQLKFPAAGTWTMYLKSQDGSKLFIEDVEVVNNDGLHSELVEKSGSIIINKGSLIKRFRLEYFKGWEGENGLILKWEGPGYSKISPGAADFYVNPNTIILGSPEFNIVIPNVSIFFFLPLHFFPFLSFINPVCWTICPLYTIRSLLLATWPLTKTLCQKTLISLSVLVMTQFISDLYPVIQRTTL